MNVRERITDIIGRLSTPEADADAILKQFVVIHRDELPVVKQGSDADTYLVDGTNVVFTSPENAREWCLRDIAVWQYIEGKGARLTKRRDEIAREFTADTRGTLTGACGYDGLLPWTRKMVDRIIELEARA